MTAATLDLRQCLETGLITKAGYAVLDVIRQLSLTSQGCFASNAYIGQRANVQESCVKKWKAKAKELGLIQTEPRTRKNGSQTSNQTTWLSSKNGLLNPRKQAEKDPPPVTPVTPHKEREEKNNSINRSSKIERNEIFQTKTNEEILSLEKEKFVSECQKDMPEFPAAYFLEAFYRIKAMKYQNFRRVQGLIFHLCREIDRDQNFDLTQKAAKAALELEKERAAREAAGNGKTAIWGYSEAGDRIERRHGRNTPLDPGFDTLGVVDRDNDKIVVMGDLTPEQWTAKFAAKRSETKVFRAVQGKLENLDQIIEAGEMTQKLLKEGKEVTFVIQAILEAFK